MFQLYLSVTVSSGYVGAARYDMKSTVLEVMPDLLDNHLSSTINQCEFFGMMIKIRNIVFYLFLEFLIKYFVLLIIGPYCENFVTLHRINYESCYRKNLNHEGMQYVIYCFYLQDYIFIWKKNYIENWFPLEVIILDWYMIIIYHLIVSVILENNPSKLLISASLKEVISPLIPNENCTSDCESSDRQLDDSFLVLLPPGDFSKYGTFPVN